MTMFRGDAARTGCARSTTTTPFTPWRFATQGPIRAAPTVADGVVYVTSLDAFVYAVDAATGVWRWAVPTPSGLDTSPAVAAGVVYVGGGRFLYALDAPTGSERWRFFLGEGDPVGSSPAVGRQAVFVGAGDRRLVAVGLDGQERWAYRTDGSPRLAGIALTSGGTASSPAVVGDTVLFVGADMAVHAVHATSGRRRWKADVQVGGRSSVAVLGGTVLAVGVRGDVVALDAETGERRWQVGVATSFDHAVPAAAGDTVYVAGRSNADDPAFPLATTGDLYALDVATGERRWHVATTSWVEASPAVDGDTVYLATRGSSQAPAVLGAYDRTTGAPRWERPLNFRSSPDRALPLDGIRSSPTVAGRRLYLGTPSGHLCVFDTETGDGAGPPGWPPTERITRKLRSWLAHHRHHHPR
jgi:eukaryotic-like serine/threonine-protein kinase